MVCVFVGMWSFPPRISSITACRAARTKGVASALTKKSLSNARSPPCDFTPHQNNQGTFGTLIPKPEFKHILVGDSLTITNWGDLGRLVAIICPKKSLSPLWCSYRLNRLKPKHQRWFWERGGDVWEQIWFLLFPIVPLEMFLQILDSFRRVFAQPQWFLVVCWRFPNRPKGPNPLPTSLWEVSNNKKSSWKNFGSKYPFCLVQVESHFIHVLLIGSFANKNTQKLQLPFKSRTVKRIVPWKCWWLNSYKKIWMFSKIPFFYYSKWPLHLPEKGVCQMYSMSAKLIQIVNKLPMERKNTLKKSIAVRFYRERCWLIPTCCKSSLKHYS